MAATVHVDDEMKQVHGDRRTDGQTYSLGQNVIGSDRVGVRVTTANSDIMLDLQPVAAVLCRSVRCRFELGALLISKNAHTNQAEPGI